MSIWRPLNPSVQTVKRLPAMREMWVRSLGREDTLQQEMATHSSILGWRILWTEESAGLQSMGLQTVGHDWATSLTHSCNFWGFPGGSEGKASAGNVGSIPGSGRPPGEGNGNPLQYSCLENPMDREAWWDSIFTLCKMKAIKGLLKGKQNLHCVV